MAGFEPATYSFAYTSILLTLIRGLDCIFLRYLSEALVSRSPAKSFVHNLGGTVLALRRPLTVIRDSQRRCRRSGQGYATHHGVALPAELHWRPSYIPMF